MIQNDPRDGEKQKLVLNLRDFPTLMKSVSVECRISTLF